MNRQVAICNDAIQQYIPDNHTLQHFSLHATTVPCGMVATPFKAFDPQSDRYADYVLLKKKAFSCNYRDKSILLDRLERLEELGLKSQPKFYALGSEFSAEIISTGKNVKTLSEGDRVIGNGNYPSEHPDARPGLPSNNGSKEFEVLHYSKVIKIPDTMPWDVAACFTIGAQTSYSMIRKLQIQPGDKVLVTSATSNTSLFAINALKKFNVEVYAVTTRDTFENRLLDMGVRDVFVVKPETPLIEHPKIIQNIKSSQRPFSAVIDPFFDIYFEKVVDVMGMGARYTTCGLYHQHLKMKKDYDNNLSTALAKVLLMNITIFGNCLGSTQDLQNALDDYQNGVLQVTMDETFSGDEVEAFFDRTFNSKARFGKVSFTYNQYV